MTLKTIILKQKKVSKALKTIHPDNPLAYEMTKLYRDLETKKNNNFK